MGQITEKEACGLIKSKLSNYFAVSPKEATKEQIYKAVVMCVRDILLEKRSAFNKKYREKGGKRVYYLCMEFLLGQSLKNNTYNLNVQSAFDNALKKDFNCSLE
ncbi:MAG: alpha-glucan phosphorylase, partial [Clostridia bacterium]|nr:alpha-glucan phosphorylase [Clostridia bacterium]